jgi:septal ring factor EnvC (AmiA/AmiB activator)
VLQSTPAGAALTARLAEKQEPTARLAAALQTAARRPLALSALQPGSLKEVVYMRAVLDSAVPQIRARTAGLRAELDRGRALEADAARALAELRDSEQILRTRRADLAALDPARLQRVEAPIPRDLARALKQLSKVRPPRR